MSKTVHIGSASQFDGLLQSSKIVVVDFYADWCGPCKQIAPVYEQLSAQLSRPNKVTFAKVNTDTQADVARKYKVTVMPTFIMFKNKEVVESFRGADPRKLSAEVRKVAAEADSEDGTGGFSNGSSNGSGGTWTAFQPAKGYSDVTNEVDVRGLDLLNSNTDFGAARVLFNSAKPSTLDSKGKTSQKKEEEEGGKDWVESDTDEQLMLYMPFMSTMKVHSLYITSLPPKEAGEDSEEVPMRPKELKLYTNRPNVLGFDEAEDVVPAQEITLTKRDWDENTGTAKVELRFVKFQNVRSLVVFIVDGDGEGEKTRIDRIRIVGESGEKRDQGKLEKVGHDD